MKLYWASTEDHHEDWFIVAATAKKAAKLHEDLEGYDPGDARVEEILTIPADLAPEESGWPSHELLLALGATFIGAEDSRVVEIGGKTFCEGLLAATINEMADDLFEQMGQDRLNKTGRGPDIPADFPRDVGDPRPFPPPAWAESEEDMLGSYTCGTCGAVLVFEANDEVPGDKLQLPPGLRKKTSCPECGCRTSQETGLSEPEQDYFAEDHYCDAPIDLFGDGDHDDIDLDDLFGFGPEATGECMGCDSFANLDDLGLCDSCAAKLARDLIRERDWAYSALAFGVPEERREELREKVIAQYGEKLELIAPSGKRGSSRKRKNKKKRRKGKGH
ncbi:MAG: hypothetical protein ABR523_08405 [Desulfurivibrionaceae bacterium]